VKSSTENELWVTGTFVSHAITSHSPPKIFTYPPYRELLTLLITGTTSSVSFLNGCAKIIE